MGDRRGTGESFDFCPPHRQEIVPDAGLPVMAYQPQKGKKSQIYNEEIARVVANGIVSAESPDFFKSSSEFASECVKAHVGGCKTTAKAAVRDRKNPNNARPRAAGLTCVEKSQSSQLRTHDPARIQVQAMCSSQSPRWFKAPTEDNKAFFEANARVINATTDTYNFEPTPAQAKQLKHDEIQNHMKGHLSNNTYCSMASPDWMKTTFDANRDHFKEYNIPIHRKPSAESDVYREYPIEKRINLVVKETGETLHPLAVSKLSPRWMKAAYLTDRNREFFEKKTGTKLNEPEAAYFENRFRERPGAKTARRNMVSVDDVPHFMKSSVMLPADQQPHPEVQMHKSHRQRTQAIEVSKSMMHKQALQSGGSPVPKTTTTAKSPMSPKSPGSRRSSERSSKAPVSARAPQQGSRGNERRR